MRATRGRRMLSWILSLVTILAMAIPVQAKTVPAEDLSGKLVILHTNDTHGHDITVDGECIGYAGLATLKEEYEAAGADVLLLSAGDEFQGAAFVNLTNGFSALDIMNRIGYDCMTIGNHEFDYSKGALKQLSEQAKFPLISANIINDETKKTVFPCNCIFDTPHGYKVGVFGVTTPNTATISAPKNSAGYSFLSGDKLYAVVQEQVNYLRAQGCDLIVALGHMGLDADCSPNRSDDIMNHTHGIDVFIDGHSHTEISKPIKMGDGIIVSTGCNFANVGKIVYDKSSLQAGLISAADAKGKEDAHIAAVAQIYQNAIDEAYAEIIAHSPITLNGTKSGGDAVDQNGKVIASFAKGYGNRVAETNFGDLTADAIKYTAEKLSGEKVDFAITNGGGIRECIVPGDVSRKDLLNVFPFGNTVTIEKLSGAQILEMLEAQAQLYPEPMGAFAQVSEGIKFTIDNRVPFEKGETIGKTSNYKPANIGSRIKNVMIGDKQLDLGKVYTIATNDYITGGGDTYYVCTEPVGGSIVDTGYLLDLAVSDYMATMDASTLTKKYSEPQGRFTILN